MKKVITATVAILLILALAIPFTQLVFADENDTASDGNVVEYTVTIPFTVPEEEEKEEEAKKPKYEDLASRFLTMDSKVTDAFNTSIISALKKNFSTGYATLADYFNYGIMYNIVYTIDNDTGVAYQTSGRNSMEKKIAMNAQYFKTNRSDIGALTHELTHSVQCYKDAKYGATPSAEGGNWVCEGMTDWSRYMFDSGSFSLPSYSSSQSYTDSYRVTARFFIWVNENVESTFIEQFNEALKCEAYSSRIFVKITGKTIDELWQMYADSDHKIVGKAK